MAVDGGLRPLFRQWIPEAMWTSIETGMIVQGVPDSHYCIRLPGPVLRGACGWIEYKQTQGWAVTLRPEQISWHTAHARAGGRSLVAVRRQNAGGVRRGDPVDELWMLEGAAAIAMSQRGLELREQYVKFVLSGGPSRWDWGRVIELMKR